MRNLKRLTLVACLMMICGTGAFAQKLGYINSQELITVMPERETAMANYQRFVTELQETLDIMGVEFNTKFQEYQTAMGAGTMTPSIQEVKERELSDMQTRIEEFRSKAEQDASAKYEELLTPVIEKAQMTIDKVAKENSFTVIFDIASGAIPYVDESTVTNILPMVKASMGIK